MRDPWILLVLALMVGFGSMVVCAVLVQAVAWISRAVRGAAR